MVKILKSPLSLSRLALALVLVVAFSVAMWAASPQPAKAITVAVSGNGATATIGSPYTFTVTINVQSTDKLPVQAVDIRIASTTNPGMYSTTLAGLPVPSTPNTSSSATVNGASVTAQTNATWGAASLSPRYGYGYGYSSGTPGTTITGGSGIGYGYGTSGYIGTAAITYTVSWTPPAWSTTDTYQIVVLAYLTSGDSSTAFTQSSASTFTLAAAPAPAGGAVGGGPAAPGTLTYNAGGQTTATVTNSSTDSGGISFTITVPAGTTATVNGQPIDRVTVSPATDDTLQAIQNGTLTPPTGYAAAYAVNLGPSGAHFSPPVTVTINVPSGVTLQQGSSVAFYNTATHQWVTIDNAQVNTATGTITFTTDHFTLFAVVTPAPAVTMVTPTPNPTPTATAAATATPTLTVLPTTGAPLVTTVTIPAPTATATVLTAPSSASPGPVTGTSLLWPIIIGVIGAIIMAVVVRYAWNLRRD